MNQYPNGPGQPYQQQPGGYPPNPGYPPQGTYPGQFTTQPGYQQPPQIPPTQPQPKKKSKKLLIALGIIVGAVVLCAIIASASHSSSSSTTSTSSNTTQQQSPSKPQTWQTTHTFTGSGEKKTETIAVPDDWKIQWSCDPTSFYGGSYNIMIGVYNSDATPVDAVAINDICKAGNTSGETEERQAGNIYLDVNSEGSWTITVQELK